MLSSSTRSNCMPELAPMNIGIPYIHVAVAIHCDYSGYTPLCIYGDRHHTTPEAIARNRKGVAKFAKMLRTKGSKPMRGAPAWKSIGRTPDSLCPKSRGLPKLPESSILKIPHWPSQFHHTGPFHDGKGRAEVDFPWERLTGEPLIYASMGTILNGQAEVFQTIAAGVAKHKDVQLVLSNWRSTRAGADPPRS